MFGLTVGISSATGPVLGGLIIALAGEENGWRWLFLVNIPIGLVAMVAILRLVPRRAPRPDEVRAAARRGRRGPARRARCWRCSSRWSASRAGCTG